MRAEATLRIDGHVGLWQGGRHPSHLQSGYSASGLSARRGGDLRTGARQPAREALLGEAMRRAPALPNDDLPPLMPDARPGCPMPRRMRRTALGGLASGLVHAAMAVAAVALIPAAPILEAERGGERATEIMVVGAEDLDAALAGATRVSITIPAPPPVEPLSLAEPEITLPPLPELAPPRFPTPPVEAFIPAPDGEIPPLPNELTPSPRPVETVPPPQPTETRKAERRRIDPPKVAKRKPVPRKAEPDAQPKARGETGNGEAAANRAASARGGTQGASATAGTASITSYRARIVAHLSRFKTYPEQARDRGIQGRNSVTLTIGRDGRVISAALAGASGHSMLDAATLAAVRRATPFPAMPDGSPPTLTVTIGLNYDLR